METISPLSRLILWTSMVDFWLGANPMILVITKVDLLAKGTDFNCIGDWVVEATVKKKLNVMSVHLTSSKSLVGVAGVALEIQKKKKGRDVDVMVSFLVGILEVYLVLRLLKCWEISFYECFTETDGRKGSSCCISAKVQTNTICCSWNFLRSNSNQCFLRRRGMPGYLYFTNGLSEFSGVTFYHLQKLYDTPGVHLHHRQAAVVHSEAYLPLLLKVGLGVNLINTFASYIVPRI